MELSPRLPIAPPCADLENVGPAKATVSLFLQRGQTPVTTGANCFSVPQQLTLGVALAALGGAMWRAMWFRPREEPAMGSVIQPRSSG